MRDDIGLELEVAIFHYRHSIDLTTVFVCAECVLANRPIHNTLDKQRSVTNNLQQYRHSFHRSSKYITTKRLQKIQQHTMYPVVFPNRRTPSSSFKNIKRNVKKNLRNFLLTDYSLAECMCVVCVCPIVAIEDRQIIISENWAERKKKLIKCLENWKRSLLCVYLCGYVCKISIKGITQFTLLSSFCCFFFLIHGACFRSERIVFFWCRVGETVGWRRIL